MSAVFPLQPLRSTLGGDEEADGFAAFASHAPGGGKTRAARTNVSFGIVRAYEWFLNLMHEPHASHDKQRSSTEAPAVVHVCSEPVMPPLRRVV